MISDANFDLEGQNLSLIDFLSEDDCLYVSPPRDPPNPPISDDQKEQKNVKFLAVQASKDYIEGDGQAIHPFELSDEQKARKNEKYNLRKSLAWDNAFSTSAGFLEPEELSTMIRGVDQSQKRIALPGIEGEICPFSKSICTFATDKSMLGTLKNDMFGDMSASAQISSKACQDSGKAGKSKEELALTGIEEHMLSNDSVSTPATDCSTFGTLWDELFKDTGASIQKSSKASRSISQGKAVSGVKASQVNKSSDKVGTVSQNKLMTKSALKKPSAITKGPGKTANKVSPRTEASKSEPRTREIASPHSKPPKITARASSTATAQTKRASMRSNGSKVEKDIAKTPTVPGRGTKFIAKSSLRSSMSSKTPASSIDSFKSLSSSSSKHSSEIKERKIGSKTNKCLKSLSKASCSISPASSISEWSSHSMSPTSTLNNRSSISRHSIDTSSWNNTSKKSDSNFSAGNTPPVTGLLNKSAKIVSTGSGALNHFEAIKPSGLRMPSPKIGFFDGAKSMVRTPSRSLKSPTVPCNMPRSSGPAKVSPGRGIKEARPEMLQPATTVMAIRGTKAETKPKSPLPLQEATNVSPKTEKHGPILPLEIQNKRSPGKDEQCKRKIEKVATKDKFSLDSEGNGCKTVSGSSATCNTSSVSTEKGEVSGQKRDLDSFWDSSKKVENHVDDEVDSLA